jgi:hypothetical protein
MRPFLRQLVSVSLPIRRFLRMSCVEYTTPGMSRGGLGELFAVLILAPPIGGIVNYSVNCLDVRTLLPYRLICR